MSVHIVFETPQDVQEQVYEMVKSLGKDGKGRLKKGANEVTKSAERGTAQMVVMAENVNPGASGPYPDDLQREGDSFHLRGGPGIPGRGCGDEHRYQDSGDCGDASGEGWDGSIQRGQVSLRDAIVVILEV